MHEVLIGASVSVSLVTEEDNEYEDDTYVNVTRAGGAEDENDGWQDMDDSWLEMETEEGDNDDGVF
jgi:hypothetical protein